MVVCARSAVHVCVFLAIVSCRIPASKIALSKFQFDTVLVRVSRGVCETAELIEETVAESAPAECVQAAETERAPAHDVSTDTAAQVVSDVAVLPETQACPLTTANIVKVMPPRWASTVECSALSGLCYSTAVIMCCFNRAEEFGGKETG